MKRVVLFILLFFIGVNVYLLFNPIVILSSAISSNPDNTNYKQADTVNILGQYNFDVGDWVAYVILYPNDKIDLIEDIPSGHVLKTNNPALLKGLQKSAAMVYTNTDMATVENKFLLFRNKELILESSIVLDKNIQGFQNSDYGWLQCINADFAFNISNFKRVYKPVVIL